MLIVRPIFGLSGLVMATLLLFNTSIQSHADAPGAVDLIDVSKFLKFSDEQYSVFMDESVDRTIIGTVNVTKIQRGVITNVQVVETASGTYSSDGIYSPRVKYPGISVEKIAPAFPTIMSYVWNGTTWHQLANRLGQSFSYLRTN